MSSLENQQQEFLAALQSPHATAWQQSFKIKDNSRMKAQECLAIYQRSYISRLLTCMREQFPALCYCLGQPLFDDFCKEYLANYKPSSYTLYELGRNFPKYLSDTQPESIDEQGRQEAWVLFMIELANFEYKLFTLFDAKGDEANIFATETAKDDQLRLQKCLELGSFKFDVASYYHAVRNDESPDLPAIADIKLALVRKDYLTHTILLSEPHYQFLTVMQKGGSVNDALKMVSEMFNLPLEQVTQSWQNPEGIRNRWIKSGFFLT